MNRISPPGGQQAIENAYRALSNGERRAARRWAERAAALDPSRPEPWYILATVSGPRAREVYRAQAALLEQAPQSPAALINRAVVLPAPTPTSAGRFSPRAAVLALLLVMLAAGLVALVAKFATLPGGAVFAALSAPSPTATATLFPTPTATPVPASIPAVITATPTTLPTATASPTPTVAPTATASPAHPATATELPPTATPTRIPPTSTARHTASSSYVVQSGDTLGAVAQRFGVTVLDLMISNHIANASMINTGQELVIPASGSAPAVAGNGQKRIEVVLSEQKMYVYQGDQIIYEFVVSTGRNDGTSTGSFEILDKIPNAYSDPWGFWMPQWMGIYYTEPTLENGIHALPVLASGQTIWGESLGTPASYGCVVLSPEDSNKLFNWATIGTPVIIRQ